MKKLLYPLLYLTVGLLIGMTIGNVAHGKISEKNATNYVNLKCLHSLGKDYESANGRFPVSLDALISWSTHDDKKTAMLEQVKHPRTANTTASWKFPEIGITAPQADTVVITSGPLELGDGRQMEISINYAGNIILK